MAEKLCDDRPVSTAWARSASALQSPMTVRRAASDCALPSAMRAAGMSSGRKTWPCLGDEERRLADHVADADVADRRERPGGGA